MHHMASMPAMYGDYPAEREASGTAWQPDSSRMSSMHFSSGEWNLMFHGFINGIYDAQGGKRGKSKSFSESMFSLLADRKAWGGTLGLRSMFSLDPLMGKKGYPLLLQTGETYDGIHPLIDRQHPHDFFVELAGSYSMPLGDNRAMFMYFGLPGEPALGPPVYLHRFSAEENPEAPISHHWLDSTHITYGVGTAGFIWKNFKFDTSVFRGREPNENRWDIESPRFDSYSARISFNPNADFAFQASFGYLHSPEQLEPDTDIRRITVSAIYNRITNLGQWQTTFAWGRNKKIPGKATNAYLLESALNIKNTHSFFTRFEHVEKDELFTHDDPLFGKAYTVKKITGGYIYYFKEWLEMQWGIGSSVSVSLVPKTLQGAYSDTPVSYMIFLRLKT